MPPHLFDHPALSISLTADLDSPFNFGWRTERCASFCVDPTTDLRGNPAAGVTTTSSKTTVRRGGSPIEEDRGRFPLRSFQHSNVCIVHASFLSSEHVAFSLSSCASAHERAPVSTFLASSSCRRPLFRLYTLNMSRNMTRTGLSEHARCLRSPSVLNDYLCNSAQQYERVPASTFLGTSSCLHPLCHTRP